MYEYTREKPKLCYSNNCSTKFFVVPLVYGYLSALVRHMRMVAQLKATLVSQILHYHRKSNHFGYCYHRED